MPIMPQGWENNNVVLWLLCCQYASTYDVATTIFTLNKKEFPCKVTPKCVITLFEERRFVAGLLTLEPFDPLHRARLAQSVEHETLNLRVVGSSPTLGDLVLNYFILILVAKTQLIMAGGIEWLSLIISLQCNVALGLFGYWHSSLDMHRPANTDVDQEYSVLACRSSNRQMCPATPKKTLKWHKKDWGVDPARKFPRSRYDQASVGCSMEAPTPNPQIPRHPVQTQCQTTRDITGFGLWTMPSSISDGWQP